MIFVGHVLEPTKDQYPVGVPRGYLLSSSLKTNVSNMFSLLSVQPTKPKKTASCSGTMIMQLKCKSKVLLLGGSPCFALSVNAATLSNSERCWSSWMCWEVLDISWQCFTHLYSSSVIQNIQIHCQGTNLIGTKCIMFVMFCSCTAFFNAL